MNNPEQLQALSQAGRKPYESIIITNLDKEGPMSRAMVFKIPPTIAEHNVIITLLQRLRLEHPGAWYCVQEWERNLRPKSIGTALVPISEPAQIVAKVKQVSREHLGLPAEDPIGDVPA